MNRMQRTLVVDTSIARSAGGTEHPISKACRDFMEQVRNVGHCIAVDKPLLKEWQKHRSNYSLQWLSYMQRRGKIKFVELSDSKRQVLTRCIQATEAITPKQKDAVRKDILLMHCAWASDELVSSLDEKMRQLLSTLAPECPEIGSVVWVNPSRREEIAVEWVKAGARTEERRRLRNWDSS